jgi:hypothetical protein
VRQPKLDMQKSSTFVTYLAPHIYLSIQCAHWTLTYSFTIS